ncbi:hypothetical protein ACFC18_47180 [Streptomyces sp. NPDC056121]|uniref:hypothetical protein n=1 Tax=unclassified Streptomyces TaxID=2593676 RepID=UPI0033FEC97E
MKKITDGVDELLASYNFPAEHRAHLRTTSPTGSTFSTVETPDQDHPKPGQPDRRAGQGLQTHRVRPGPLKHDHRTPPESLLAFAHLRVVLDVRGAHVHLQGFRRTALTEHQVVESKAGRENVVEGGTPGPFGSGWIKSAW